MVELNTVGRALVAAASTAITAGLALTGCGSDQNTGEPTGAPPAAPGPADCGGKNALTAEGSTSQQNAIAVFNQAWGRACAGKHVTYNPTGSGAGREQFIANHVDFAGSDSTLTPEQTDAATRRCAGNPVWHLPLVFGPIALAYHLDGVDNLVVTGDVLAKIFSGEIAAWNDPAIRALNPRAKLPASAITPIYRSDSSGTTDNFQKYLTATAPRSWTRGSGSEFSGGVGEGAEKSTGVVEAVQTTPGAIGYVEKGFADQAGIGFAQLDSGAGAVALTETSARTAIEAATFETDGGPDSRLNLNSLYGARKPGAYPLIGVTYEIVCSKGYAPDISAALKSFLAVAASNGQSGLAPAGYVPLPERFQQRLAETTGAIG
jgi:phosphate transport system substrate-binding protein